MNCKNMSKKVKLSTHIPMEYIKQSKKFQEVMIFKDHKHMEECYELGNGVKIFEVIDNAEMLFGKKNARDRSVSHSLLSKCFNNKSIEEISKYVLDNIKD